MKKTSLILSVVVCLAAVAAGCCAAQSPVEGGQQDSGFWQDEGRGAGGRSGTDAAGFKHRSGEKGVVKQMAWSGMGPGGQDPEDDQEVAGLIKKHDPAFAAKLAELKKTAPKNYRMLMRMTGKMFMAARLENDENMEKNAVRAFSLEYETKELARKYDKVSDAEKDKIKHELGLKVSELFELRLKSQELKVQRMEKDLARLRKGLETKRANKAKIVEERVGQLTGDGYGWY